MIPAIQGIQTEIVTSEGSYILMICQYDPGQSYNILIIQGNTLPMTDNIYYVNQ